MLVQKCAHIHATCRAERTCGNTPACTSACNALSSRSGRETPTLRAHTRTFGVGNPRCVSPWTRHYATEHMQFQTLIQYDIWMTIRDIFCDNIEGVGNHRRDKGPLWGNHITLIAIAECYRRSVCKRRFSFSPYVFHISVICQCLHFCVVCGLFMVST